MSKAIVSHQPRAADAETPGGGRRAWLLRSLVLLVVLILVAAVLWYFHFERWHEQTDDAYVNGNLVQITPLTVGTAVAIGADDGMRVRAGQTLVQLDPADAQVALEQAEANLAHTVREVRGLYHDVESARAELAARQVTLQRARVDFTRRRSLATAGAISAEELSHSRDELAAAGAALTAARAQLARSRALVDGTVVLTQPEVQAAAAQLRQAYLARVRDAIVAPVDGFVARRTVQLGQRVQAGTVLMAVVPLDQVWVDANFKETQLRHMRLGQEVELESDLYGDDLVYHGRIVSLGLGTGSAFSLLPAQNASGNWIKIVQRLPVRIRIDAAQLRAHPLRIGLSMRADVDLHDQQGAVLPPQAVAGPVYATGVYSRQLHDADALIGQIIARNLALPAAAR